MCASWFPECCRVSCCCVNEEERKYRTRSLKRSTSQSEVKSLTAFEAMAVRSPEVVETVATTYSAPPVQETKLSTTTTDSTWSGAGVTGSLPVTTGVPAGNGSVTEVIPNAGPAVKQASLLAPAGGPIATQGMFATGGTLSITGAPQNPQTTHMNALVQVKSPSSTMAPCDFQLPSLPSSAAPGAVQSQSRPPFVSYHGSQPPNASTGPSTTVSYGLQPSGVFSSMAPASRPQGVATYAPQLQNVGFAPQSGLPINSATRDLRPTMQISAAPVPQPQGTCNLQFESMAPPRDMQPQELQPRELQARELQARDLQTRDLQSHALQTSNISTFVGGNNFQSQSGYSVHQFSSGTGGAAIPNIRDDSVTSDLFDMIDRDHDGRISLSEFRAAMDKGFFTSGDSFPAVFN